MKKNIQPIVFVIAISIIMTMRIPSYASIRNVPLDYPTIQSAIDNAANGDTILVQDGIYYENIILSGRYLTLQSMNGATSTIVDGNLAGSVLTFSNNDCSIIDGFTLQGGAKISGGGINCQNSSPTIKNCLITNNNATSYGGGIYCASSSPHILGCVIINNNAQTYYGGGLFLSGSAATISDCTIHGNRANTGGGGIYASNCSPAIANCTIKENTAGSGGGIYGTSGFSATLSKCIISDNFSSTGGGLYLNSSSPGMSNCIISHNRAATSGGGLYLYYSSPQFINCTMSRNVATKSGGALYVINSSPQAVNCIFWADMVNGCPNEIYPATSNVTLTYSDIQGGWKTAEQMSTNHNLDADPLFLDAESGDFRLLAGSPCHDAGDAAGSPADDVMGIMRPQGDGCDLGAYEYDDDAVNTAPLVRLITPNGLENFFGTRKIEWSATDAEQTDLTVDLYFSQSAQGPWAGIATDLSCTAGQTIGYDWDTTSLPDGEYWIWVEVSDGEGASGSDSSDLYFSIRNTASCTIVVPDHYATIQVAINAAYDGCYIMVRNGTYTGNINFKGKKITLYSENGPQNTTIRGSGGSVVTFNTRESSLSVLDGFTITAGTASGIICDFASSPMIIHCIISDNTSSSGGGIYCKAFSSPTIVSCLISNNITSSDGAGIYINNYSSPEILDCTINNNKSSSYGGGIYAGTHCSVKISGCTLSGNSSLFGGAFYADSSTITLNITDCLISSNTATYSGGGLLFNINTLPSLKGCSIINNIATSYYGGGLFLTTSAATITDCIIRGNIATTGGGGIYGSDCSPGLTNCTIKDNIADLGGGIYGDPGFSPQFINCLITKNTANAGGGIYFISSSPVFTNCTISGNTAGSQYGGIFAYSSATKIINSILWDNGDNKIYSNNNGIDISFSDVTGGWPGNGNIYSDPRFEDHANGNYRLNPDSPCINHATDDKATYPNIPDKDLDGIDRPQGHRHDMGAFEFQCLDLDNDGYYAESACGTPRDCNDNDPGINPGALELCDGVDNNCDGSLLPEEADFDADGFRICNGDCDDKNAAIYPGATELCDGRDDNCDGVIPLDELDTDSDGIMICEGDCDDHDANTYPAADEICDGKDNDCNSDIPGDEVDKDNDGYRLCNGDCDDTNAATNPGATEICDDNFDNNCDGQVNENCSTCTDYDGDGYYIEGGICSPIDCDDSNSAVNPGVPEICDGLDNNCDGQVDENGCNPHDVELRQITVQKQISNCKKNSDVKILIKNNTSTPEIAEVILYKDDIEVYRWNNVNVRSHQALNIFYSYDPSSDSGQTVYWTAEVIIAEDQKISNNFYGPEETKVLCNKK